MERTGFSYYAGRTRKMRRAPRIYTCIHRRVSGVGGTYWSASSWVGKTFDGEVDNVHWGHPDKGVYIKNDTDGTVSIVSKFKSFETVGDTGTGRIDKGCSGTYPVPINFDWECIEVGAEAAKKRGAATGTGGNSDWNRAVHEAVTTIGSLC